MNGETPIHDALVAERHAHPQPADRPARHRWIDEPPTEPIPRPTGRHRT